MREHIRSSAMTATVQYKVVESQQAPWRDRPREVFRFPAVERSIPSIGRGG
jgi:hypothetical protein